MAVPISDLIPQIADHLGDQYRGITEADDIAQEIHLWALTGGRAAVNKYVTEGDERLIRYHLRNAGARYCEKERRASLGYDWRDDYSYSRPEVARILPLALDPSTIPGLSGGGLHDGPSAKSDPAYGGGMLASIVDVRVAFSKLSESDQAFVQSVVDNDLDWDAIGEHHELQSNSAYQKWMRILDKMVTKHLGRRDDAAA